MIEYSKKITEFLESLNKGNLIIKEIQKPKNPDNYLEQFCYLKELVRSDEWPEAVNMKLVGDDKKELRASSVLNNLGINLSNKKVLDFGCGEGHLSDKISNITKCVGYDPKPQNWKQFEKKDNLLFTKLMKKVISNEPYDVIIIYDVLDHMIQSQTEILTQLKNLLSKNGVIYVKCHPYTSRHAIHQYYKLNKAFIHLIFSREELIKIGVIPDYVYQTSDPEKTYEEWFEETGFQIEEKNIDKQNMEKFFCENEIIYKRMTRNFNNIYEFPYMNINFIEYKLKHKQ